MLGYQLHDYWVNINPFLGQPSLCLQSNIEEVLMVTKDMLFPLCLFLTVILEAHRFFYRLQTYLFLFLCDRSGGERLMKGLFPRVREDRRCLQTLRRYQQNNFWIYNFYQWNLMVIYLSGLLRLLSQNSFLSQASQRRRRNPEARSWRSSFSHSNFSGFLEFIFCYSYSFVFQNSIFRRVQTLIFVFLITD